MAPKAAERSEHFFQRRTPEQQRADARFSAACDTLAAALEAERQMPTPTNRKARQAAEKDWEAARRARDQARIAVPPRGGTLH